MAIKQKLMVLVLIAVLIALFSAAAGCGGDEESQNKFECYAIDGTCIYARTAGPYFEVYKNGKWRQLTVKGVNIGTSLPGRWYTEFPADRALYRRWLEEIAAMNANNIRIYTLLDPAFYAVLAEFNLENSDHPLWLIQEIWPDDAVPEHNFYDSNYKESYLKEIELVLDALHGNADIPGRPFRAYGNYSVDVSPWLLGLLVGRELEPEEVTATNEANPDLRGFEGVYVKAAEGASATEVWLAEMCDFTAAYSMDNYSRQYPVGFVSWPTLDPLTHPTEWEEDGKPGYNDREVVDPNIFSASPANQAGFFGAYHIYPNYPDFINNEPAFAEFTDAEGVFRYKGYLNHFMNIHPPYPALVAEFGISTSLNTAHLSPDGLHHGGLSEQDQGEMVVRMMKAIMAEGYAGGIIFEWSDEWAKKTWNTEPFMVPWDRQVLWQNAMCPEQNYGVLAVEPAEPSADHDRANYYRAESETSSRTQAGRSSSFGRITAIGADADEAFLYLYVSLDSETYGANEGTGILPLQSPGLMVAIKVDPEPGGETLLPLDGLPELPGGAEFMLTIHPPDRAEISAVPSYNRGMLAFAPELTLGEGFSRITTMVNRERITADGRVFPALYSDESILNQGLFEPESDQYNSLSHWYFDGESNMLIIRLPWMLLNIADPSSHLFLKDDRRFIEPPGRDELGVAETGGLSFYVATFESQNESEEAGEKLLIDFAPRSGDSFGAVPPYRWAGWEEPQYRFRLKKSYEIIAAYFDTLE